MKRCYADTPEGQIHYRTEGSGEPLLMLHQIGLSSDQYLKVIPILSKHYQVLAMDIIGYGYSDQPPPGYKTADYARSTFHFLDALKIKKISIVGARFGGSIGVEMAASQPGRVDKFIISTCTHLEPKARDERGARPTYRPMEIKPDGSHLMKLWETRSNVAVGHGPEMVHNFVVNYLRSDFGLRAEDGHKALYSYNIQDRLPLIKCPTLLIYGTGDAYYDRREVTRKLIPRCKIKLIEGARSLAMYEKPEEYSRAILEFLENPEA
ncbi:MAG: alpha/beta hydrolase [Chloroflexi bacterium]|nr:alpha/beta hydrolase [Chloroflexota bacterium]